MNKSSVLLEFQVGQDPPTLPDELENRLREHLRKQGDLSHIVTEALESYHDRIEKKGKMCSAVLPGCCGNQRMAQTLSMATFGEVAVEGRVSFRYCR